MKNNLLIINKLSSFLILVVALACGFFFSGCDTEEEPVPAYLEIKPFILEATDISVHGSISQKITHGDVIFIDQEDGSVHSLGVLTLPITVPVRVTGTQEIIIDPFIKNAGNSFNLQVYPFYERYSEIIELPPNEDVSVQPVTQYIDGAVFEFIEGFEGNGHRFQQELDGNPNTFIEISDEDVFEGNSSGKIYLDTGNIIIVTATNEAFNINFEDAIRVYMEVNYKTDVPLQFGVQAVNNIGQAESIFEFAVLENTEWNKIYFNMTDIMFNRTEENFTFALRAGLPIDEGGFPLEEAKIYLDNIKVVHF